LTEADRGSLTVNAQRQKAPARQPSTTLRFPGDLPQGRDEHGKEELTLPRYFQGVLSIPPFKGALIDG
jgi:hypothetical protein